MKLENYINDMNTITNHCQSLSSILIDKGDLLEEMAEELNINLIALTGDPRVVLEITDIKHLSDVRRVLRTINGSWKDKQKQVWSSGRNVLVSWENKDNPLFEIWLCTVPEEFPEELKGKNCNFEERIERTQVLVCKR